MKIIWSFLTRLFRWKIPGPLYLHVESFGMTQYRLQVLLPPVTDNDVSSREFSYTFDGGESIVSVLEKDAAEFEFLASKDVNVHMELVDIDTSGNRSPASFRDFLVTDTIPPHKPGDLAVSVIGQI